MEVKDEITTLKGKKLQLIHGDLTNLPENHRVDILVLSAFYNEYSSDYNPTRNSLIGALDEAGLSVEELAQNKEVDLRTQFNCWLSKEINFHNIKRILCFEAQAINNPYSLIVGIFQSIMAFSITHHIEVVAMPLILTGDQGYSHQEVLKELISTSLLWLNSDSPLRCIKIVERNDAKIELLKEAFKNEKLNISRSTNKDRYDFFISYSRKNSDLAKRIHDKLKDRFKVFFDTESIRTGENFLKKLNKSLANSERFIVCLSTSYVNSERCKYEYRYCNLRAFNKGDGYVLPIRLNQVEVPEEMGILEYYDATKDSIAKVDDFCEKILKGNIG